MTLVSRRATLVAAAALAVTRRAEAQDGEIARSKHLAFRIVPLLRGLENPWALAFHPDGRILITERAGRLRAWRPGDSAIATIAGAPPVAARAQGGLLDICLHPRFATNQLVYLSYAGTAPDGAATRIARARLTPTGLAELQVIFEAAPRQSGGHHFGSRLVFDRAGHLFATTGDRYGSRDQAQAEESLLGKIVRLNDDGSAPADNPLRAKPGARAEIFSLGHRNPQGMAMHPTSGAIWSHEHGPRGGDEINVIRPGANYGWPRATHGIDYSGATISPHKSLPGMVDPIWVWTPSIAPSGMAFYAGDAFPAWRGNLFVGALAGQMLVRLELDGERVVSEERLLERRVGRVRDVRSGPDGRLYLLTDSSDGQLLRLDPA